MSTISAVKLSNVLSDFISERIIPGSTGNDGFWAGFARGVVQAVGANPDSFVARNILEKLNENGMVDPQGNVDIEILKGGINGGFSVSSVMSMFGYRFDRGDGDAIIALLEKYKNE